MVAERDSDSGHRRHLPQGFEVERRASAGEVFASADLRQATDLAQVGIDIGQALFLLGTESLDQLGIEHGVAAVVELATGKTDVAVLKHIFVAA